MQKSTNPTPKVRTNQRRQDVSKRDEDPLEVFARRFMALSWRVFNACPLPIKAASPTIAKNYGIISICDTDPKYALAYYRDTIEESLKDHAYHGNIQMPKEAYWQIKGCIFDVNTGALKARGFSFTPCVSATEQEFNQMLDGLAPKALIREWREGDVVMVWTDDVGVVRVSKTRRINALRSRKESCPSIEEMLNASKVDLSKLRAGTDTVPIGTMFVLLLVHPLNQVQNPDPVEQAVYHLDTWVYVDTTPRQGKMPAMRPGKSDTFLSLKRKDVDIGLPKLKALSFEEALELFRNDKSIYVQHNETSGVVYRSLSLAARYIIRGNLEHLYLQYVVLGTDGKKLYDCVPYAYKEKVAEFPTRYASDCEALYSYCEEIIDKGANPPSAETSLAALLAADARLRIRQETDPPKTSTRERLTFLLSQCPSVVLYNMISLLRTKYKKRDRLDISSENGSRSTSPSD